MNSEVIILLYKPFKGKRAVSQVSFVEAEILIEWLYKEHIYV